MTTPYPPQIIEIEAETLEEARSQIASQIPQGLSLLSESIISDGSPKSIKGIGSDREAALARAFEKTPSNADVLEIKELSPPGRKVVTVESFSEEVARERLNQQIGEADVLTSFKLSMPGRRGFLGIGKQPAQYEAELLQQAVVEVICRTKAKLSVEVGDKKICSLVTILGTGRYPSERAAAAKQLGEIRHACAVEPLIKASGEYDDDVQRAAINALAEIGDPRAIGPLIRLYERGGLWEGANPNNLTTETLAYRARRVGRAAAAAIKRLDPHWLEPHRKPEFMILFREGTDQPSAPEQYCLDIVERVFGAGVALKGWRIAGTAMGLSEERALSLYHRATAWEGGLPNWGAPIKTWHGKALDEKSVVALFFA
jgi:hypothetical protein